MTTAPPPALRLERIAKTFPGQVALNGVSLTVGRAQVHALVGQNGSGKSTLIKILTGYHEPDPGGTVHINGRLLGRHRAASAHKLGLRCVHQTLGLIDELSVLENLILGTGDSGLPLGRVPWKQQRDHVQHLLQRVGVGLDPARLIRDCSAVERTAVAVARAIDDLSERGVLLLDEPTAALPPHEAETLFGIVRELTRNDISVLYVSHRLEEIFEIADYVSVLRGGELVATKAIKDVDHDELVRLMVGSTLTVRRKESGRSPSTTIALRVEDLQGAELNGVSFEIPEGQVLGVAGLLGSGRAELPYLLSGNRRAKHGAICIGGKDILSTRRGDKSVAFVPGDRAAEGSVAAFSVRENMTLGDLSPFRRRTLLMKSRENSFVREWIENVDVRPPQPEHDFSTLSGGNQQKVVMAKWLGVRPRVLVIDEPTVGVDIDARAKIYDILRDNARRGLTVVACSSDTKELTELCDRVLVLADGEIALDVAGQEISEETILHAMMRGKRGNDAGLG
jgi:ribose transport system ATP-binding protein